MQKPDAWRKTAEYLAAAGLLTAPASDQRKLRKKEADILLALQKDPNATHVAKALGDVALITVWRVAQKYGIKLVGRPTSLTPEVVKKIEDALSNSPNPFQASLKLNGIISRQTVYNFVNRKSASKAEKETRSSALPTPQP